MSSEPFPWVEIMDDRVDAAYDSLVNMGHPKGAATMQKAINLVSEGLVHKISKAPDNDAMRRMSERKKLIKPTADIDDFGGADDFQPPAEDTYIEPSGKLSHRAPGTLPNVPTPAHSSELPGQYNPEQMPDSRPDMSGGGIQQMNSQQQLQTAGYTVSVSRRHVAQNPNGDYARGPKGGYYMKPGSSGEAPQEQQGTRTQRDTMTPIDPRRASEVDSVSVDDRGNIVGGDTSTVGERAEDVARQQSEGERVLPAASTEVGVRNRQVRLSEKFGQISALQDELVGMMTEGRRNSPQTTMADRMSKLHNAINGSSVINADKKHSRAFMGVTDASVGALEGHLNRMKANVQRHGMSDDELISQVLNPSVGSQVYGYDIRGRSLTNMNNFSNQFANAVISNALGDKAVSFKGSDIQNNYAFDGAIPDKGIIYSLNVVNAGVSKKDSPTSERVGPTSLSSKGTRVLPPDLARRVQEDEQGNKFVMYGDKKVPVHEKPTSRMRPDEIPSHARGHDTALVMDYDSVTGAIAEAAGMKKVHFFLTHDPTTGKSKLYSSPTWQTGAVTKLIKSGELQEVGNVDMLEAYKSLVDSSGAESYTE